MQRGKMHPDRMQWIPCSVIECSVFHAAWRNGTLFNAVDFMQHDWMQWIPWSMIECNGFMQHCPKHPDWMQWIPCSVVECRVFHAFWCNGSRLYAVESMQRGPMHPDWMQWILCSMAQSISIECVDSIHCDWIQCAPCSVFKCIPIECSGVYAVWRNGTHWM